MIAVGDISPRLKRIYAGGTKLREIWTFNGGVWKRSYYALQAYSGATGQNELPQSNTVWTQYHAFTVNGSGPGILTVTFSWGANGLHFVSDTRKWRMMVNGVTIGTEQSQSFTTGGWEGSGTGTVNFRDGDTVTLWGIGSGTSYTACRTVISRAIMITPT